MARARNIKPSFFDNDLLAELDPMARLLFIGMWTIADFKGDFEWREKRVKAKLLPYDDCNIKELAISLDNSGFVRFYSDGDKIYCRVVNFNIHQNPHKNEREKGSDIPEYSDSMRQVVDLSTITINLDKNGTAQDLNETNPADSLNLIPDSLNTDSVEQKKSIPRCEYKKIAEIYNEVLPELPSVVKWTETRRRHLKARWDENKEMQSMDSWRAFFEHIRNSEFLMGKVKDFKADFDWIINASNFVKIYEGRYHA